jgi:uncharacterized membrane protein YraQ (UPF0718 family)
VDVNKLDVHVQSFRTELFSYIWAAHRVWLTTATILLVLKVFNLSQGLASGWFTLEALIGTAPSLLLSIGLAAYAGVSGADNLIARAFVGSPLAMIVFAAILGGLSPFCSCGVIPLIAALLSMGVPLAGVMAFWLASPVIDPSMFVLTVGLLGFEFAVAKTIIAIALGLFGGLVTMALTQQGFLSNPLKVGIGQRGCESVSACTSDPVVWKFWIDRARRLKFMREALATTLFLLKFGIPCCWWCHIVARSNSGFRAGKASSVRTLHSLCLHRVNSQWVSF